MTEDVRTHVRRKRKAPAGKRRRLRLLLFAFLLLLFSGALLHHKDRLHSVNKIFNWIKQGNPEEVIASVPSTSLRGDIYDRNFRPLAATYKSYAIYARPLEMEDHESTAGKLAQLLGLKQSRLLANLKSERGFTWVAKGIDQELANTIRQLDLQGIYQIVESKRFYPNFKKAAHIVGFVENGQGLAGIEYQYNTILRGDETTGAELKALNFPDGTEFGESSTHLVLNLDLMIQSQIEQFLDKRIKITGASSGSVILMNADTGAILALASYPSFNPNRYWEFSSSSLSNNALSEPVYPGELGLIFQQAAALNLKNKHIDITGESLGNTKPVPIITPEILKRRRLSTAPRVKYVDPVSMADFTRMLGFSPKRLADLPLKDETPVTASLNITDPSFNSSALRLLNGFTTLVNGGRTVSPHLLYKAYQNNNTNPFEIDLDSTEQRSVLNANTSRDLVDFLATKWLKLSNKEKAAGAPLFLETHRLTTSTRIPSNNDTTEEEKEQGYPAPYLSQSVMLGAIPGKNPKLTIIAVLSFPDSCDGISPDVLKSFGSKFSLLSPDDNMIRKMLHVASMPPPSPSPDFWKNSRPAFAGSQGRQKTENENQASLSGDLQKNMPDLTGKSLRAGLQILQHLDLNIKLIGSGRIVSQKPPAGTELVNVEDCIIELQQEI